MILRNTTYNLIGLGLPLVVAIFTIPLLIESLGVARFGVLTLIWAIVSYISLLDMGLGRALTLELSVLIAKRKLRRIPKVLGTTYFLMTIIGFVLAAITAMFSENLAYLLKGLENYQEVINALYVMALAIPFVILSAGARGVLEANGRFDLVNIIRVPVGTLTFLGPMLVVWFWDARLDYIALALLVVRVLSLILYYWYASQTIPENLRRLQIDLRYAKPLVTNGGWMTVSNIISPLMGYVDRFLIGAIVSASAVAYYATPHEVVTKLAIIPSALTAVLFPFLASMLINNLISSRKIYEQSTTIIFYIMLPFCATLMLFEQEILTLWISEEFALNSKYILSLIALGMLINSMANMSFTILQSAGRAKITAKIHILEFPFFIALLWWMVTSFGAIGAAFAWIIRLVIDTFLMVFYTRKVVFNSISFSYSFITKLVLITFSLIVVFLMHFDFYVKIGILFSYFILSVFILLYIYKTRGCLI